MGRERGREGDREIEKGDGGARSHMCVLMLVDPCIKYTLESCALGSV